MAWGDCGQPGPCRQSPGKWALKSVPPFSPLLHLPGTGEKSKDRGGPWRMSGALQMTASVALCVSTLHLWPGGGDGGEKGLALSQDPAWPGSCLNHTSSLPHPCYPLGCSPFVGTATGTAKRKEQIGPQAGWPGLAPSGEAGWLSEEGHHADLSSLGLGLRARSLLSVVTSCPILSFF